MLTCTGRCMYCILAIYNSVITLCSSAVNRIQAMFIAGPRSLEPAQREQVLDRYNCHTVLSPSSMHAFRTAGLLQSAFSLSAWLTAPLVLLRLSSPAALPPWIGSWSALP